MSDVLKSELLRSFSGLAMLGVASFALLIPSLMLTVGPPVEGVRQLDDGTATRIVFGLIASIGVVAMYLGSYSVSREHYYRSMPRSLVITSVRRVLVSKLAASAITSVLLCVLGGAIWAGVSAVVLAWHGRQLQLDAAFWAILLGSLFAAVCGAAIGTSLGWVVRNYYAVSGVVLLIPLMIELPLLFTLPMVERFLPVGAFAGVTGAPIDGLLPWWGSALVLVAWVAGTAALAVVIVRRRER
ncbi:hypothetical protein [Microbacterium sp. PMB16]|uniref:hypothetical protein n=1 Tax=Microbacterium sp. PMB16 TaxID=3120157 RepID=UPI003F4C027A